MQAIFIRTRRPFKTPAIVLIQRLPVREETVQTFNVDIAIDVFESGYRRNVIALIAVSQRGYNGGLIGHINRDGGIGPLPVVGTAVNEAINQNLINILPVATINEEPLTILIVTLTKILLQQQIWRFVIVTQELTQRFGTTDLAIFKTNKSGDIEVDRLFMASLLRVRLILIRPKSLRFSRFILGFAQVKFVLAGATADAAAGTS